MNQYSSVMLGAAVGGYWGLARISGEDVFTVPADADALDQLRLQLELEDVRRALLGDA
jgi:hypothetical protein